jgi:hypothetical protein
MDDLVTQTLLAIPSALSADGSGFTVTSTASLVAYWPAENKSYKDVFGGNNGTPGGTVNFEPGEFGQAFSLGGSQYIEVPDAPDLDLCTGDPGCTGQITLDGWIYPSGTGGIVTKNDNGAGLPDPNWSVEYDGVNEQVLFNMSSPDCVNPCTNFTRIRATAPLNTWSHFAATSDGVTMNLYVNGSLAASGSAFAVTPNNYSLLIGAYQRNGVKEQFFIGQIDEAQIFRRALSVSEVQALYSAGKAAHGMGE